MFRTISSAFFLTVSWTVISTFAYPGGDGWYNGLTQPGLKCRVNDIMCSNATYRNLRRSAYYSTATLPRTDCIVCCADQAVLPQITQVKKDGFDSFECYCPYNDGCLRGSQCDQCPEYAKQEFYNRMYCCKNFVQGGIVLRDGVDGENCTCSLPVSKPKT